MDGCVGVGFDDAGGEVGVGVAGDDEGEVHEAGDEDFGFGERGEDDFEGEVVAFGGVGVRVVVEVGEDGGLLGGGEPGCLGGEVGDDEEERDTDGGGAVEVELVA